MCGESARASARLRTLELSDTLACRTRLQLLCAGGIYGFPHGVEPPQPHSSCHGACWSPHLPGGPPLPCFGWH